MEWDPGHNLSSIEGTRSIWTNERISVNVSKRLGSVGCLVRVLLDSIFHEMKEANRW